MAYLRFPEFSRAPESIPHLPLDVEFVDVAPFLRLAQRDQKIRLVSRLILVNQPAWAAAVIQENVPVPLGLVLIGNDVVLAVSHPLSLSKSGPP